MKLLALTGGVGGAKLALGLSRILSSEDLMFMVNTGLTNPVNPVSFASERGRLSEALTIYPLDLARICQP